jgi:hypothetical protein|tara:strand:+ start:2488 stop:2703 length:216 start_codon:yes stop_codon:yes gene_type:complete
MGCGCKKKKAQQAALNTANSRTTSSSVASEVVRPNEKNLSTVEEKKDYQDKVKDALKQLMDLKRRKRSVRF